MDDQKGLNLATAVALMKSIALKYESEGITSVEFVPPNGIKFILSDGSSNTIYLTFSAEGIAFDDATAKLGAAQVQSAIDKIVAEFARLAEENTFVGKQNFNGETEFNSAISANANVTMTNSALKILDNTNGKDLVTQYNAEGIVVEDSGNTYDLALPKKSGTLALTTDVPDVSVDDTTISKTSDGKLQAVGLTNGTNTYTLNEIIAMLPRAIS